MDREWDTDSDWGMDREWDTDSDWGTDREWGTDRIEGMRKGSRLSGGPRRGDQDMGHMGQEKLLILCRGDQGCAGHREQLGLHQSLAWLGTGLSVPVTSPSEQGMWLSWAGDAPSAASPVFGTHVPLVWHVTPLLSPTATCLLRPPSLPHPVLALLGTGGCAIFGLGLRLGNVPWSGSPGCLWDCH